METKKIELFLDRTLMQFNVVVAKFDEFDDPLGFEEVLFISEDYFFADAVASKQAKIRNLEVVYNSFEYC